MFSSWTSFRIVLYYILGCSAVTLTEVHWLRPFMLGLLFDPKEGENTFFRNVGERVPDYTALHPRT
jgi:hypothetical protein